MAEPGFWDDQTKAQTVINENNELKAKYDNFHQLATAVEELEVLYELVQEAPEAEMFLSQRDPLKSEILAFIASISFLYSLISILFPQLQITRMQVKRRSVKTGLLLTISD